jgi:acetylornithine/succinyldiaminopimelate/putrescine aminotransferase
MQAIHNSHAFQQALVILGDKYPTIIKHIRCLGMWAAIEFTDVVHYPKALCIELANRGLLCRETRGKTLRLAPPLNIDPKIFLQGMMILQSTLEEFNKFAKSVDEYCVEHFGKDYKNDRLEV